MRQIKITKVDNGFIVEVTEQNVHPLKERYDQPTFVVLNKFDEHGLGKLWEIFETEIEK